MKSSRRTFLEGGLVLPALAAMRMEPSLAQKPAAEPKLVYGNLGKTGLRVTRLAFGCMTTSDPSVIERAADHRHQSV